MRLNMISSAPAAAQGLVGQSPRMELVAVLKHWWVACLTRRTEQVAIAQLHSMSDRELKDIGLTRSDIAFVARGDDRRRPFCQYY